MKIGILGSGEVARSLGNAFLALGHDVMLGARRADNTAACQWAKAADPSAKTGTFEQAAQHATQSGCYRSNQWPTHGGAATPKLQGAAPGPCGPDHGQGGRDLAGSRG